MHKRSRSMHTNGNTEQDVRTGRNRHMECMDSMHSRTGNPDLHSGIQNRTGSFRERPLPTTGSTAQGLLVCMLELTPSASASA